MDKEKNNHFRIVIVTATTISLLLIFLFFYTVFWLRISAISESKKTAILISKEVTHTIELYFRDALTINRTYAENVILYKKNKVPRNIVYSLMKGSLKQNSNFLAVWTMWEPNTYDNSDKKFANDSIHDPKGSFSIAYYFDGAEIKREINDTLDYIEDFYTIPSKSKKPIILDPFLYQYHGNPKVYYETSLVSPIIENNIFIGVIGIDIDLQMLQSKFKDLKIIKNGFLSILSNSGHIVTHPNQSLVYKSISKYLSPQNQCIIDSLKTGREFTINTTSEFSHKKVMRQFYPINMEYMVAPWYIMVEIPEDEIFSNANRIKFISLAILLTILLVSAYLFLNYITKVKADKELKDSEAFNKILFQDSRIALVVMEYETLKYIDCNDAAAKIYGYNSKEEIIGKTPVDVSAPHQYYGDSYSEAAKRIGEAHKSGSLIFEWLHQRPNGEIWDAEVHLMVFKYKEKKLFQFSLLDITERKKSEEELKNYRNHLEELVNIRTNEISMLNQELLQSNEELQSFNEILYNQKEELTNILEKLRETQEELIQSEKMASIGILTAGVAHEINNPLNFIQAGIYSLESTFEKKQTENNSLENEEFFKKIIQTMRIGVNRVTEIVTSLNRFSRKNDDLNHMCNIHSIIDNCLIILNHILKQTCTIEKKYTTEEILISGNEGKLHQVFINILNNAAQSIESFGTINITTNIINKNRTFQIIIADTGRGIPADKLNKIFDPFYTTKDPGKGTGLGLSIVYTIIAEHKGTITYKSELNLGTEATIQLPINNI